MKSSASLLSPILRSDTQGRMLAELMIDPSAEMSLTELAKRSRITVPTILRDVDRLEAGKYVTARRVGRSRMVRINPDHPVYAPLRQIVMYGYGPAAVLPPVLATVQGVDRAFIFGSWAARYLGEEGEAPNDIDVLVVGSADPGILYAAARNATAEVGRQVSITPISQERWESESDGFVRTLKSRPLYELALEGK